MQFFCRGTKLVCTKFSIDLAFSTLHIKSTVLTFKIPNTSWESSASTNFSFLIWTFLLLAFCTRGRSWNIFLVLKMLLETQNLRCFGRAPHVLHAISRILAKANPLTTDTTNCSQPWPGPRNLTRQLFFLIPSRISSTAGFYSNHNLRLLFKITPV